MYIVLAFFSFLFFSSFSFSFLGISIAHHTESLALIKSDRGQRCTSHHSAACLGRMHPPPRQQPRKTSRNPRRQHLNRERLRTGATNATNERTRKKLANKI